MHELSIAESIVSIAGRHAAGRKVTKVELRVGHLRQVVPSALEFAFELVAEGSAAEGARLAIEEVPAAGSCRGCGAERTFDRFPFSCSACGGLDIAVISGDELLVDSLELEDVLTTNGGRLTGG